MNKSFPKDSYPLPRSDHLVDAISKNKILSLTDAYYRYNQIWVHPGDVVYMSFYVDNDILCYNRWGNLSRIVNKLVK